MDEGSAVTTDDIDVDASSAVQTTSITTSTTTAPAAVWVEKFSGKHQKAYWKNKVSGEVTWKNPLAGLGVVTAAGGGGGPTRKKSTTTTAKKKRKSQTDSSSTYSLPAVPSRVTGHQVDGWQTPMAPDQFVTGIDTPTVEPAAAAVEEAPLSSVVAQSTSGTPHRRASRLSILVTGSAAAAGKQWVEKYHEKTHRRYWKNTSTGQVSLVDPISDESLSTSAVDHSSEGTAQANTASMASASVPALVKRTMSPDEQSDPPSSYPPSSFSSDPPSSFSSDPPSSFSSDRSPPSHEEEKKKKKRVEGSSSSSLGLEEGWVERFHEKSQRMYWKNKMTGESKWSKPLTDFNNAPTAAPSTNGSTRVSPSSSSSSPHLEGTLEAACDSPVTAADGHPDSLGVRNPVIDGWIECYRYGMVCYVSYYSMLVTVLSSSHGANESSSIDDRSS